MPSTKKIKIVLLGVFVLFLGIWIASGQLYTALGTSTADGLSGPTASDDGKYVGTEVCKACHEDQFNSFAKTKHSRLAELKSWKDKVQGCESCHGPGGKHVEDPTVKGSIISFKEKDPKAISDTCLACHAGKESHDNYRRGEHWRNNIGCTDCHSPHPKAFADMRAESITLIGSATEQRPNQADDRMLKQSEPQLCISCHAEVKSQFQKPNHHRVLEGTMVCSDCHNPHGGFENKQTRLAVGADQACIKCHTNKQGPFVFEHAPAKVEGCTICHIPHGSANPKMLKRPTVRQLCFECHTGISEELSPQAPSLHNQAQIRYQACTVCHSAIHGSNSSNRFFR